MTRALALLLLAAACGDARLVPRFAFDPSGVLVPLGTYYDTATQRTCEVRESGAGYRCVPVAEYTQILYRRCPGACWADERRGITSGTCAGPGLAQSVLVKDMYLRAANRNELYTPCRTADPALGLRGSWFLLDRPEVCVQVMPDSLVGTIQVCPVDMTQFPLLSP